MNFVPRSFFLLCVTIPIIKAVSVRIDGLIDLGPNWTYEYRIVDENAAKLKKVARTGDQESIEEEPHDDARMKRDEERLRIAEERLRKEAAELRQTEGRLHKGKKQSNRSSHEIKEKDASPLKVLKHDNPKSLKEYIKSQKDNKESDAKETTKEYIPLKESEETRTSPRSDKVTFSSVESDSFVDSSDVTTAQKNTMFDIYDFTSTRRPKHTYKSESDETTTKKHKRSKKVVIKDSVSVEDDKKVKGRNKIKIGRIHDESVPISVKLPINVPTVTTTPTQSTLTTVTTMRTGDIYTNPHKVKDDTNITEFTNQILKQTLKVFDVVKEKTDQYHVKKDIDRVARSYEEKFKEFLADTNSQKIKTRLGTQKVILNTIEMSNLILKRLVNFMVGDMDRKGVLRDNMATANIFQKELEKEQEVEFTNACKKFGICRTETGFPDFIASVITILLRCDDKRFKQGIDALTEAVKSTNYNKALDTNTERRLKDGIENLEMQPVYTLRPTFMIIRNIISNKNKPLVVNNLSASRRVNVTLAFLEIIDLMDQRLPRNEANASEWSDIKNSLTEFADSKRYDVQDIMEVFVRHLKKSLKTLDKPTQKVVSKNINIIL
ncbi:uncharacterized protein LOC111363466, partial [Spodoptera litura]|uniref:Uncharacterized protein LOC111363466 n=1 Tax=Spodoptera litura TaxID=69820 RepID=A0A9J7ER17_SPOLT